MEKARKFSLVKVKSIKIRKIHTAFHSDRRLTVRDVFVTDMTFNFGYVRFVRESIFQDIFQFDFQPDIQNDATRYECQPIGPWFGQWSLCSAKPQHGHIEGHSNALEVRQEHSENHAIHEDGVSRQVSCCCYCICNRLMMHLSSNFRYARAERDLKKARPFGEGVKVFFEQAAIEAPKDGKELLIAMTSDRGLCGAVHTGVARSIRNDLLARQGSTENTKIVCVGDKSRAILQRLFADKLVFVASEVSAYNRCIFRARN